MIKKKYLTEVSFKNGVDEFKSTRSFKKEILIETDSDFLTTYRITLNEEGIELDSMSIEIEDRYEVAVQFRRVNGEGEKTFEVYTSGVEYFLPNDKLVLNYVALNTYNSDLYSVDYKTGTLYLSQESNVSLKCYYEFYNFLLKGTRSVQLHTDEYDVNNNYVSIKNPSSAFSYTCLYNLDVKTEEYYTTPYLKNVRINFITNNEESL